MRSGFLDVMFDGAAPLSPIRRDGYPEPRRLKDLRRGPRAGPPEAKGRHEPRFARPNLGVLWVDLLRHLWQSTLILRSLSWRARCAGRRRDGPTGLDRCTREGVDPVGAARALGPWACQRFAAHRAPLIPIARLSRLPGLRHRHRRRRRGRKPVVDRFQRRPGSWERRSIWRS
jgi:hypothetical protein